MEKEMDAIEYLKIKGRMCIDCEKCGLSRLNNKQGVSCGEFEIKYPEKAIEIVEEWNKENPLKTNLDVFEELHQQMEKKLGITLNYCDEETPSGLCHTFENCEECQKFWNSEYKEER